MPSNSEAQAVEDENERVEGEKEREMEVVQIKSNVKKKKKKKKRMPQQKSNITLKALKNRMNNDVDGPEKRKEKNGENQTNEIYQGDMEITTSRIDGEEMRYLLLDKLNAKEAELCDTASNVPDSISQNNKEEKEKGNAVCRRTEEMTMLSSLDTDFKNQAGVQLVVDVHEGRMEMQHNNNEGYNEEESEDIEESNKSSDDEDKERMIWVSSDKEGEQQQSRGRCQERKGVRHLRNKNKTTSHPRKGVKNFSLSFEYDQCSLLEYKGGKVRKSYSQTQAINKN